MNLASIAAEEDVKTIILGWMEKHNIERCLYETEIRMHVPVGLDIVFNIRQSNWFLNIYETLNMSMYGHSGERHALHYPEDILGSKSHEYLMRVCSAGHSSSFGGMPYDTLREYLCLLYKHNKTLFGVKQTGASYML